MNDTEKYLDKLERDFGYMLKHTSGYVYPGWMKLIQDMLRELDELHYDGIGCHPEFTDIKDKFGTLRVYGHNFNDETQEIIDKYERLSAETCATCGAKGELRVQHRWLYVACEEHKHGHYGQ